ncbi:dihydrolipoyl dehydrogenase [candidate division KSB1 bacterium]
MEKEFDIVVVGGGPGGYVAAIRAVQLGFKTAIVEKDRLGGVCLNWGCIPTKALLKNAELLNQIKKSANWGINVGDIQIDFPAVVKRSRKSADMMSKGVAYLMRRNKIEQFSGTGKFLDNKTVEITDDGQKKDTITGSHIIIATGGRARPFPGLDFDGKTVISSKEAMVPDSIPESLVIIGGGAIGVEFAYFYASFGSRVTVLEMLPHIVPNEDEEVARTLTRSFEKMGITVIAGARVEEAKMMKKDAQIKYTRDSETNILKGDKLLVAIGVKPNTENIGIEGIGVEMDRGFIKVDSFYRTNVSGVYAIGDCIGGMLLAHVASAEGVTCVEKIAGKEVAPVDYGNIPACTYCQPQIASIGLTESKAAEKGYELKIGKYPFKANGKSVAAGETEGFVKLIFDAQYGELLGAHIIGHDATELIGEIGIAKTLESTYLEILKTVHAHPTVSESVMEAAGAAFGEAIHI